MSKKWRSISIDEKVYAMVSEKQQSLIKENGNEHIQIGIVAEAAILCGIDKVMLKVGKIDVKDESYDNRFGRMHCPECSHFLNEDEIKDDKCPICKRVTLMRRFREEDV